MFAGAITLVRSVRSQPASHSRSSPSKGMLIATAALAITTST
jgi:hypothetical protein